MGNLTKGQDKELNKIAILFADGTSKEKGFFPKDKKFNKNDKIQMLKNSNIVVPTIKSVFQTPKVIKKHDTNKKYKTTITKAEYEQLNRYIIEELEIDAWGVAKFTPTEIYKGQGIPYADVIVMSKSMNKDKFSVKDIPSMDCQLEVMKVYGDTGIAALRISKFLRNIDIGAVPNHSLGGNIDYTKAGLKANLGFAGKHGMLITPQSGPCNRISIVYTSIENLGDFIDNHADHSWGYDFCNKCRKCVRQCPHNAIYDEAKIDGYGHVECISNDRCNSGFVNYGCGICIGACPFTTIGYKKLHAIHLKKEEKQHAN